MVVGLFSRTKDARGILRTPNEHRQMAAVNQAGGSTGMTRAQWEGKVGKFNLQEGLAALRDGPPGPQYEIVHAYKSLGTFGGHHSQLFVKMAGAAVYLFNFGLYCDPGGQVEFICYGVNSSPDSLGYKVSSTYSPNPVKGVTGIRIFNSFVAVEQLCAVQYDCLENNCQKFARLFMEDLGATHKRSWFHP